MLRPTKSAIIFTQQLGRGLRKVREKKYLTVIDFIGNYKNNYQIPIALFGDTSYNKDELRRLIQSGSELIPGSSTVNFDKIAKEQIFKSITDTKFEQHKLMKREYELLKHQLGRSPMMVDFLENEKRDPYQFVKKYKSYFNFVNRVEQDITEKSLDRENKLLEYFSLKINDGKRILDSLILNELLDNTKVSLEEIKTKMKTRYNLPISDEVVI